MAPQRRNPSLLTTISSQLRSGDVILPRCNFVTCMNTNPCNGCFLHRNNRLTSYYFRMPIWCCKDDSTPRPIRTCCRFKLIHKTISRSRILKARERNMAVTCCTSPRNHSSQTTSSRRRYAECRGMSHSVPRLRIPHTVVLSTLFFSYSLSMTMQHASVLEYFFGVCVFLCVRPLHAFMHHTLFLRYKSARSFSKRFRSL